MCIRDRAIGLVLSMSGITIALFLVTKQMAALLTGGAMLLLSLIHIFATAILHSLSQNDKANTWRLLWTRKRKSHCRNRAHTPWNLSLIHI